MQNNARSLATLSDAELLLEVKVLAADERQATARLIASLAELDARRLYLGEGYPSLFAYCTRSLHLSEHAAYNRIKSARAVRQFPEILDRLAEGAVTPTAVRLLAPHLTAHNLHAVLNAARHKTTREVEQMVAELSPRPDVPALVRRLPAATASVAPSKPDGTAARIPPAGPVSGEPPLIVSVPTATSLVASPTVGVAPPAPRPAVVAPLAPERYKVQFTVGRATHDKLRRAQDLMRHAVPNGDPAAIFDRALTLLIEHLERTKMASVKRPREERAVMAQSRHIPAEVKRVVWSRDAGRCGFVGGEGRCPERGFLEFHHVVPYADGGPATVDNIQLRCRAHNQFEDERWAGEWPLLPRERQAPQGEV